MTRFLKPLATLALVACACCASEAARAQQRPGLNERTGPAQPQQRQRRASGKSPPPGAALPRDLADKNPLRPSPEDFGPLRPGEEDELIEFTRQEMPRAYRLLKRLAEQNPQAYDRQIQRFVPRARHLRRIFERDAELGRIVIRYSENLWTLRRAKEEWRRGAGTPRRRERIGRHARRLLAENLRLEAQAIERWISLRTATRERDVERKLQRLSRSDALELSAEPTEIREALAALRNASGPGQRRLRARLKELLSAQVDAELARLHERVARLRANPAREVDRRLRDFLASVNRGPPRGEKRGAHEPARSRPRERGKRPGGKPGKRRAPRP